LRNTVRFSDALHQLFDTDCSVLLEVGPGRTLSGLAHQHSASTRGCLVLQSLRHPSEVRQDSNVLLNAVGRMWQAGVPINWDTLHHGEHRCVTGLPTYPFERQQFRLDTVDIESPPTPEPLSATIYPSGEADVEHTAPASDIEAAVAKAFGQVLGLSEISTNDNFFDLGGDSLVAVQLRALIRETVGVEVTVRTLFESPTVALLAKRIDKQDPT